MHLISESITNIILFVALYFEVFLLITYFEHTGKSKNIEILKGSVPSKSKLPSVSIIVPVWNEEKTVLKTIFSLLKMNYPKTKLFVYIVDDGSTDSTWSVVQRFEGHPQVKLLRKENGGKHTALNHALQFIDTDLVGCLDADSFVHGEALKRIVSKFENQEVMAVTPSVQIQNPVGILGMMQKTEYIFGIFLRKVFAYMNAIYITPGPFSIFRRRVFDEIGFYRKAHNTEDMEIAMRMQRNNMKIENVHNAFVYTVAPTTLYKLYKQRLRWTYGFLKNAIDYRDMFFKPQYGHLSFIVLPAASFSFLSTIYFFGISVYKFINSVVEKVVEFLTVGFKWNGFNFDLFYVNTDMITFVSIIAIFGTIFIIVTSRKLAEEKTVFGLDSVVFLLIYTIISPIWMTRALYNAAFSRGTKWR